MAAYCRVYGVIHFTSPVGPKLGIEYGKTLPFLVVHSVLTPNASTTFLKNGYWAKGDLHIFHQKCSAIIPLLKENLPICM